MRAPNAKPGSYRSLNSEGSARKIMHQWYRWAAVSLALIVTISATGIILKSTNTEMLLKYEDVAIKVIMTCYGDRRFPIGIGGNISESLVKALAYHRIPVVLITNSMNMAHVRYNLQLFIITTSSLQQFQEDTEEIVQSGFWDQFASNVILYRSSDGCEGTEELFGIAWYMDMLETKLICINNGSRTFSIQEYNPFSSTAPEPWRVKGAHITTIENDLHPLTVLERAYRGGQSICRNLRLDKLKNINGYPINVLNHFRAPSAIPISYPYTRHHTVIMKNIFRNIIGVLNATWVLFEEEFTYNDSDYADRTDDVMINSVSVSYGIYYATISRAFRHSAMLALTRNSGVKSQLEKILTVIDHYSRAGLCVVLLVTVGFFILYVRQSPLVAVLNVVRIICNTGFTNLPSNSGARFYLTAILLSAVTMQGIYQGNLAALLTKVVPLPNLQTWDDFIRSPRTIYIDAAIGARITYDPIYQDRVIRIAGNDKCIEHLWRDPSAICYGFDISMMDLADQFGFHVSDRLEPTLEAIAFRPFWPLCRRFDTLLARQIEADVLVPLRDRHNETKWENLWTPDDDMGDGEFRVISLTDLIFAFDILGIGLMCASMIFIVEKVNFQFSSRNSKRTTPM